MFNYKRLIAIFIAMGLVIIIVGTSNNIENSSQYLVTKQFTLFNKTYVVLPAYNSTHFYSYGYGGKISIFSEFASHNKPFKNAFVYQSVILLKQNGNNWNMVCNLTINMTDRDLEAQRINIEPGYYEFDTLTVIDYANYSIYVNATSTNNSAYTVLKTPSPILFAFAGVFDAVSLGLLISLTYFKHSRSKKSNHNFLK
ncbi:MAG: hypothetical protein ACYDAO_09120 [Thermoplasmataceae archaeon]